MSSDLEDLERRIRALEHAVSDLSRRLAADPAPKAAGEADQDDAASVAMDAAVGPEGFPAA